MIHTRPGAGWCRCFGVPVATAAAAVALVATAAGQVVVSEFLAHNTASQIDEDGDFSDWIELHNRGAEGVTLVGWSLTDDASEPRKWVFPEVSIGAGGRLLVFASGKGRRNPAGELHANFQLDREGEYLGLYRADGTAATEFAPAFPPQRENVSFGVGLPGSVATTDITPTGFRPGLDFANLSVSVGGGASELAAFNLLDNGLAGGSGQRYLWADYEEELRRIPDGHRTVVSATLTWLGEALETFGPFTAEVGIFPVPPGGDDKGVSALFPTSEAGLMAAYYAAHEPFAEAEVTSPGHLVVAMDVTEMVAAWIADPDMPGRGQFMTLASGGPMRVLWQSGGPRLTVETSAASGPGPQAVYFLQPTPLLPEHSAVLGFVEDTRFSVDRGFFDAPLEVEVTTATAGATVYVTTDGSPPLDASGNPTATATAVPGSGGLVSVTGTTVLRAAAAKPGWHPTNTDTQTYIFAADTAVQTRPEGFPAAWGRGEGAVLADYGVDPRISSGGGSGQRFAESLRALPVLSVVGDTALVFGTDGVYGSVPGAGLEVPVSAEWMPGGPGGGGPFQIDAGLVAEAGGETAADGLKRTLGLRFRGDYGAPKLDYPLFGTGVGAAVRFDGLRLLAAGADGWGAAGVDQRARATFVRDAWARATLRAMGDGDNPDGGRGRFAHLFLNGLYWGVYEVAERFDDDHFIEYNGAAEPGGVSAFGPGLAGAAERADFGRLKSSVATRDWAEVQAALDVDSYIDHFIVQHFSRNVALLEGAGWSAAGGGTSRSRWRFYVAAAGESLVDPGDGGDLPLGADGAGLIGDLSAVEEFRVRFADRALLHLTEGGALAGAASRARFEALAAEIGPALVGESARWGDVYADGGGTGGVHVPDPDWVAAVRGPLGVAPADGVLGSWFPEGGEGRARQLIDSWSVLAWPGSGSTEPVLLSVAAPAFTVDGTPQHGGVVAPGDMVSASAPASATVYFTTDGSDPRLEKGSVSPAAAEFGTGVAVAETTRFSVRANDAGRWSPLVSATFTTGVPAGVENLLLTEVHYHPADPSTGESEALPGVSSGDFEFVELLNRSPGAIDLSGVAFTGGISFEIAPGVVLGAGQRVVLVRNAAAFGFRYSDLEPAPVVVGEFVGALDNSGESLRLEAADGAAIAAFRFGDAAPWPEGADGEGYSLTFGGGDSGNPLAWRPSAVLHGTPGYDDALEFEAWAAAQPAGSDPSLLAFALVDGGAPSAAGVKPFSAAGVRADYPFVRYRLRAGADVVVTPQWSRDLTGWVPVVDPSQFESRDSIAPGIEELTVRAAEPVDGGPVFFRVAVDRR